MQIDPSIFRAYDVRGIYPEQINAEVAYALGKAYATLMLSERPAGAQGKLHVAVGSDMRVSGHELKGQVIAALLESGIDVDDLGLVSTPTFYFGVAFFEYDGGIQVSASHNPKEWNGLKMVRKGAIPISDKTGIADIQGITVNENFAPVKSLTEHGVMNEKSDLLIAEVKEQIRDFDLSKIKKFKIVVDGSNGMGGQDMQALFEELSCEVVKINFALDGSFPGHGPDPMKAENTEHLRSVVVEHKCDLGIISDGDGDRIFFADEKGQMVPQSILRSILAEIELKIKPGSKIVYDVRPAKILQESIEQAGGHPIPTATGSPFMKELMAKEGAVFGAEGTGHIIYSLPYGIFEAPMVTTIKLLQYLSEQDKPVSEVVKPYEKYFSSGDINIEVFSRAEALQGIELIKAKYKDGKQSLIDGISVEYPDYWFNVRPSNTEPLIRLSIEAKDQKTMERERDNLLKVLKQG